MYIWQGVLLERKHGLEMGGEIHSNIKYWCNRCTLGNLQATFSHQLLKDKV